MPRSVLSVEQTSAVWKKIEEYLGPCLKRSGNERIYRGGKYAVRVAFSIYHEQSEHWWYGLEPRQIASLRKHPASYVLFMMDTFEHVLIVPAEEFDSLDTGDLHLVSKGEKLEFEELPYLDLSQFKNRFDMFKSNETQLQPALG